MLAFGFATIVLKKKFGREALKFPLFHITHPKSYANTHFYNILNFGSYHADFELKLYKYELFVFLFCAFLDFFVDSKT